MQQGIEREFRVGVDLQLLNVAILKKMVKGMDMLRINIEGIPRNACGASRDISKWYLMCMIVSYV